MKLERTSSEVGANFERSWSKLRASCSELRAKLERTSSKQTLSEVGANFERSWSKLRAELEQTSSEVGANFERSFFAKFASKWKHFFVPTVPSLQTEEIFGVTG